MRRSDAGPAHARHPVATTAAYGVHMSNPNEKSAKAANDSDDDLVWGAAGWELNLAEEQPEAKAVPTLPSWFWID